MRKIKEVLRLRFEVKLQRQIARSCSIGQATVHEYLKRAQAAGVTWPLPEGWDDRQLDSGHEVAWGMCYLREKSHRDVLRNDSSLVGYRPIKEDVKRHISPPARCQQEFRFVVASSPTAWTGTLNERVAWSRPQSGVASSPEVARFSSLL